MTDSTFDQLLSTAEADLWSEWERARHFKQKGDIGTTRESGLAEFLRRRLPDRYRVARGECVDTFGNQTGQLDLVIYDGINTRPLLENVDGTALLPAEALLATVEVKSVLTGDELERAVAGISAVHRLRPWGKGWTPARKEGKPADDALPRVLTVIFAYHSNLGADAWATKEFKRLSAAAQSADCPMDRIDRLVVLDRGLLLPRNATVAEPKSDRAVLGLWFFSLVNFLAREVSRRAPFPWNAYHRRPADLWCPIPPP